jgi:hypothetical protein
MWIHGVAPERDHPACHPGSGGERELVFMSVDSDFSSSMTTWSQFYKTFYGRNLRFFALSESVYKTKLEKLTNGKHSSLLRKSVI